MAETPLIVIVGPTASGKSALAMKLAELYQGEIIAADARTVYKGMDIGTAKPTTSDQQRVPHHLLDLRLPSQQYTAADFKTDALKAIEDIAARGRLPIMVGGSGLYIHGVIFDYSFLPKTDERTRQKLQRLSPKELMVELDRRGIPYDHIDSKNRRYLQRLLETAGVSPSKRTLRPNTLVLGLQPEKAGLRSRIQRRVDQMVKAGFVDEVLDLAEHYGWDAEAMKGIGYRAFRGYLEGSTSLTKAKEKFARGDIQLAKRQRTWFKRNPAICWVSSEQEASKLVEQFLAPSHLLQ